MIYLDHAATSSVDTEVLAAMLPYFSQNFGNPSSVHQAGQNARIAFDNARFTIAKILNCNPGEVIFSSGGTESNNLALKSIIQQYKSGHILTSPIEHPSCSKVLEEAEKEGFQVEYLPISQDGVIDPREVKTRIRKDTILINCMYVNNEIGTIQPITKIGRIAEENNIPFHCDAVQAGATLPINAKQLKVTSLSLSGHKMYGPKGIGILYMAKSQKAIPQIIGGGQEHRRRSGTENIAGAIGFSKALELIEKEREDRNKKIQSLRDTFIDNVLKSIPQSSVNGTMNERIVSNANICFEGVSGESLLMRLDMAGICASLGSACSAGSLEASGTLLHIGLSKAQALSSLRFSFGKDNTMEEVEYTVKILKEIVKDLCK